MLSKVVRVALLMQSYTVAFDLYVVETAHGVLCMRQCIKSSGERKYMQWNCCLQLLCTVCAPQIYLDSLNVGICRTVRACNCPCNSVMGCIRP